MPRILTATKVNYQNRVSKKAIIELDDSLLTPNELRAKREQQNFKA